MSKRTDVPAELAQRIALGAVGDGEPGQVATDENPTARVDPNRTTNDAHRPYISNIYKQ